MFDFLSKLREVITGHNAAIKNNIPASERMIILGNAPLRKNLSDYIDSSALVVRFNECKNLGRRVGTKTDYLCINNLGPPANRYVKKRLIEKLPFLDEIQEIWIPRSSSVMLAHSLKVEPLLSEFELRDRTEDIVSSNSLWSKKIVRFSEELNLRVIKNISRYSQTDFMEPSTGILAIEYVLSEARFRKFHKILLGFNFKGWFGHPWDAEEALLLDYAADRDDFHL